MSAPDPRLTLARADLADSRLEGLVRARAYAPVRRMTCTVPVASIRKAASEEAGLEDQLLYGEAFDVLDEADGWAFGQAARDGYVGHVRTGDLAAAAAERTHRVSALRTYGFSRPDLKSPPVAAYALNALLSVGAREGRFLDAGAAGWVFEGHVAAFDAFETDAAGVAERHLGAPYLWGGRDSGGVDCSGLVQQALYACGRACPRDSDKQMAAFAPVEAAALARGDLVFWRGHVGLMLDAARLIHANAHHMAVEIEPLSVAVERIRAAGAGDPTGFRRP